jgi:hypothetical protein
LDWIGLDDGAVWGAVAAKQIHICLIQSKP